MLTAGHCVIGGNYTWFRYGGNIKLGSQVDWSFEPGDCTIQYKDGSEGQITNSQWASDKRELFPHGH
ncbi:hypothetical protein [Streptomyces sp. NPDC056948]|uniref:hypothetical protein n=1 Tax=Streptomyces sp. NPDC056948 TaxID=3345975 RepID=UPI00362975F7